MQKGLRIGVDLDGVTYEFEAAFRAWASFRLGRALHLFPPARRWGWYEDLGIDRARFHALLAEGVEHGRLFAVGDPVPDAVESLRALAECHTIVVITHRNLPGLTAIAEAATHHWLQTQGIPYAELHLTGDKAAVATDIHLDDSPEVIAQMRASGRRAVVFDQPWNRHVAGERACGWREFVSLVDSAVPSAA
ncbi:MAG TPA: hypothetical protein VHD87_15495 [Acidimicrobiales bacterium]|nr:hypothetical protein [Acidimicrobiales bacterium]